MSDSILLEIENGLAHITLNRPARLNAVDFEMGARWRDVAAVTTSDPAVTAILLDAAGPAFCAGGDVVAMSAQAEAGAEAITGMARVINEGILSFVHSSVPIVAAVQGAVAGGGLGLMLCADYIVAADSARFVSKYANIGLTPDLGVSTLLPAAIGQRRAMTMLLQDRSLDAAEAADWGLVNEIVPKAEVAARAREVATFWHAGATTAFGQAKRLVRSGIGRSFAQNLDDEAVSIGERFATDEAQVRIQAFAAAAARQGKDNS
ncbi:enoyl-CoA hydratase/isomerase family protein [Microbacterium sediminicola]|uniref:Enoyl-CoA hydratase/isomerase family protein n=1 Tax=Microbacterium sediminicola TaxID=415210 RepID=A0ABP4UEL1_9MICO